MKRLLSILITAVILLTLCVSAAAYSYTDFSLPYRSPCLSADNGYLYGYNGSDAYIGHAVTEYGRSLKLDYRISGMIMFGDIAVMLCNDDPNNQLIAYTYDITSDSLDSVALRDQLYLYDGCCAYNGSFFMIDNSDNRLVRCYSSSGKMTNTYRMSSSVSTLMQSPSGGVYAIANKNVYWLHGEPVHTGLSNITSPAVFFDDRLVIDSCGVIFSLNGSQSERLCQTEATDPIACQCSDYFIVSSNTDLLAYARNSGRLERHLDLTSRIIGMCSYGSRFLVLTENNRVSQISPNELIEYPRHSSDSINDTDTSRGYHDDFGISSNAYYINNETMRISLIHPGTSITNFKSNIQYDGYDLTLYKDGEIRKSGNISTAMRAKFMGENELEYELSVIGDITGEGRVTSKDTKLLMSYLLGLSQFNGVYLLSADIDGDNTINSLDLVLMTDMK